MGEPQVGGPSRPDMFRGKMPLPQLPLPVA